MNQTDQYPSQASLVVTMASGQQEEWCDAGRKRSREDEYADIAIGGTLGFTEHRSKRLQALPLRTSPNSKRLSWPPAFPTTFNPLPPVAHTITPADSDSEETANNRQQHHHERPKSHFSPWSSSPTGVSQPSSFTVAEPVDSDMDMMDTAVVPNSQQSSDTDLLEPGTFQPDPISSSITGRMPTPIHCSFAQQVRGNNWGGAAGNIMQTAPNAAPFSNAPTAAGLGDLRDSYLEIGMADDQSIPRSLDGPAAAAAVMEDWSMVQNRRLPSPISESGGEDGGTRSPASPGMVLDSSPLVNRHRHHHPALASLPPRASSAMELSHANPLREGTPTPLSAATGGGGSAMEVEPASPATQSPKKGHTRSRHTLNSWTLQPGMKKSFSIGYRADCEKCRLKVPGHFNHIIIS